MTIHITLEGKRGCPQCERLRWALEKYHLPYEYRDGTGSGRLPKLFIDGREISDPQISDIVCAVRRKYYDTTDQRAVGSDRNVDEPNCDKSNL